MDRAAALAVLDRLQDAQRSFHSGGEVDLSGVLTDDIEWIVPGRNSIAGSYRGLEEVLQYFTRRRAIAEGTFQMSRRDVLVGDGDTFAAVTDGRARVGGVEHHWSTVGLYRAAGNKVSACWLLPLDPAAFDEIWTTRA